MNDTQISFTGNVGGDVTVRQAGEARVATFRVAATPRHFQRSTNTWVDGETQWYTVHAWRTLGAHCERSLRRGDPVVVQGRLKAQTWTNANGVEVTTFEVDAHVVGHDLNRGTTEFRRSQRPDAPAAQPPAQPEDERQEAAPAAA